MSSQVGRHIAGAALQMRRKSMPPQAITLSPYIVVNIPRGVLSQFQKHFNPVLTVLGDAPSVGELNCVI